MTTELPDFQNPPVVEVVLGVQFEKLESLRTAQLGCLWQAFRDRFPKTEEQPPLDPVFENFGEPPGARAQVRLELVDRPPTPRLWFLSESETELVQIQQDRFIRNWRKKEEDTTYPRYSRLREAFRQDFATFCQRIEDEHWGTIQPNQCEVTYVNVIPSGQGWEHHGELHHICTLFALRYSDRDRGPMEDAAVRVKYVLRNEKGSPAGRLYVAAEPVFRVRDRQPAFRLTLTARGQPTGEGNDGVFGFFDLAHEAIVLTFTSITTPEMHRIWRRRQ